MHRLLTIITTMLLSLTAMAQRYSVTVTPVLLPPYTLNLSELTAQGSAKMMATLTVNDLTAVNLPVRLHFKLESAGITVENIPTSAVAPLFLNGGETQILTGADMAQYLRLDNLEFRGYSKDSYRQTGQLPGGLWKVTIEVRHFHTGRVLSNRGAQTLWVSIYDPPVLTAPRNNTEAPDNPSLPLVFSWQASKHTGGTVAVQYKLELWEMRMEGVPAQTVAASMTPIFETTTQVTSYTAIPTGMNLEPGMRYCWRVTVSDPSNQAQINKNGQSEVREFTYLHTCPPVDEVTATVRNTQADFSWTPSPYHTHFRVEMLQEGGSSDVSDCYDSKFRLYDFPQGTTWRVRVRGECKGDLEADWSPWTDFSFDPPGTPPTNDECPDCGCDDGPAKREIENYELKELQPGDTIVNRTGRTRFIVLSANATGDRVYSGQFYLWLELWRTKVRCDYTDLKVNTDGVILDGSWRSVHNDGLMVNPATVAENIQNIRNGIANATFDNSISDTIKLGYAVQTIYKDENGRYIAILEDGSEHDLTQDLSTANKTMVEDSQGNKMVVTGDQQLMSAEQYHNTGKNSTLLKNDSQAKDKQIAASGDVIFKPSESQQFGFDAYDASTNNHPEIYPPLEGGSYRPAYKSVAQWQQDKVAAEPMSNGVTFRTNMGVPYAIVNGDIVLRGEPMTGETPVYAHMAETDSTTKVVGKLNLLTFEPREINVCLVPVNGATPPNAQTLEKELNKIFKPAVASVKVSTHAEVNIAYANGSGFVHGGSGPLTVYSDDEKAAINALTDANDDTYYLFLVSSVTKLDADGNRTIVSGYMPVGYQHGFIFEQFDVARTIAHELSHGAFALHHTFSANTESFRADEGTTNNLMDYTESGITLNHKQWTWMHEKHGSGLFGFLADESEGEAFVSSTIITVLGKIKNDNLKGNDETDLSLWANDNSCAEKLRFSDNLTLDFIKMEVQMGKITSTQDSLPQIEPLLINPIAWQKESAETPGGQEGDFVKVFYNRLEKNTIVQIKPAESSNLAISFVVKKSQLNDLLNLLGLPFYTNLKLYEGTKEKANDAIMYITAEPEPVMPDVRVSVESKFQIQMQLKIEYTARKSWNEKDANGNIIRSHVNELVRNDITYFPDDNADSWKDLQSKEIWDVDFGDKFRGGRAVVYCKIDNQLVDSIVFHIRGKNPQLTTVLTYAQTIDASWYVPKIIRQESSGTGSIGKQFNTGTPSATNQVFGMPNWGYPYGWGIKQLDNFDSSIAYYTSFNNRWGASPDELWNWQLNVKKGLQLFSNKLNEASEEWNDKLSMKKMEDWLMEHDTLSSYSMKIKTSTITSEEDTIVDEIIAGSGSNTETIVSEENPQGNNRSLIEADAIRRYNGGTYVDELYVPEKELNENPMWIITKKNKKGLDYVNEVCGKQGW